MRLAGMLRFELRISILETGGLPVSLHPYKNFGACGRTRTHEGHDVRLIYSQVPLLLGHTCKMNLRISDLVTRFQIHDPSVLKNR